MWWCRNTASPFIRIVTKLFGANLITVPAKDYGHDLPAMLKAITPQTRVVFVANPNNPTGTLARREELIDFVNEVPDECSAGDGRSLYRISGRPARFVAANPRWAHGRICF